MVKRGATATGAEFEITMGETKLLCSLRVGVNALSRAQGVVGCITGSSQGTWLMSVARASFDRGPMMSLVDQGKQIVADVRGADGEYEASLERGVFATASSRTGAKLWVTGPDASESLALLLHPWRIMYGFANQQTLFADEALVAVVLLYDLVFTPLVPSSGCS